MINLTFSQTKAFITICKAELSVIDTEDSLYPDEYCVKVDNPEDFKALIDSGLVGSWKNGVCGKTTTEGWLAMATRKGMEKYLGEESFRDIYNCI
jgi:hypothetical protein